MTASQNIIVRPIITEKSTVLKMDSVYVFAVLPQANKIEIKRAVEELFKVNVKTVNTTKVLGKVRRLGKAIGNTGAWKKAFVKLEQGQKIDLIEGMV